MYEAAAGTGILSVMLDADIKVLCTVQKNSTEYSRRNPFFCSSSDGIQMLNNVKSFSGLCS